MDSQDRRSKFGKFKPKRRCKPDSELNYKNIDYLAKLIGPTGKIMSRRRTGFDGQDQRKLARAVKLARFMGLLPFTGTTSGEAPRRV
jgi:small subunit ribosomal protein S18